MQTRNVALVALVLIAVSGCSRGQKNNLQREQQEYNVVQEGQASGVTGTLNAPGEVALTQTSYGVTATNADTTSAFTLPGAAVATDTTSTMGSLGATLPTSGASGGFGSYTPPPAPRTRSVAPRQAETPEQPNPPQTSSPSPAPPPAPSTPPATDTAYPAPPPPPTTTTAQPPSSDQKKDDQKPPEQKQPDQKQPDQKQPDQNQPQPPPPTQTDTRGNQWTSM